MARIGGVISWMLVLASVVLWAMRALGLPAKPAPAPPPALPVVAADLGPLLGKAAVIDAPLAAAPELAARFRLLGVMAPPAAAAGNQRSTGVALLAIDGKPPRAYRVGKALDRELMLWAVTQRSATIATVRGEPRLVLELPPTAPVATFAQAMPALAPTPQMPPRGQLVPDMTNPSRPPSTDGRNPDSTPPQAPYPSEAPLAGAVDADIQRQQATEAASR